MAWTTLDLLSTIKNREMFPDAASGSLSSAVFLQLATEELHITLVPMILGVREKYYETYLDTAITSATTSMSIPARAIGGTLSGVQYIYGNAVRALEPIDPITISTTQTALTPSNFYFENNSIVLYPPPSSTQGTIRMRYFQRPNRLEQTIYCGQITSFSTVGKTVTCSAVPSTWTTANIFDFIPQTASQATPYGLNSAITGITSNTITFTSALPAAIAVGDWVALAEYTPIPEIPFEFQVVLAQATACKGLESINDQAGLASANAKLDVYMQNAIKLLTPRDQAGSKKVVSNWRSF